MKLVLAFAFVGALATVPAIAQIQPTAQKAAAKAADPNQVICEKEYEIGTRLTTAKTCQTRAQWQALKADSRRLMENIQTSKQWGLPDSPTGGKAR